MAAPRYALYVAPRAEDRLWQFGSSVLGYDAATGEDIEGLALTDLSAAERRCLTSEPRRYGFHATLKAPFRLAGDAATETLLLAAVEAFARKHPRLGPVPLSLARLGAFFALCPACRSQALHDLADSVVVAFDEFRAPPSESEVVRRRPELLSPRQRDHLERWGYPYIFEDFRFHMTLTGPTALAEQERIGAALSKAYRAAGAPPLVVDALVVFKQATTDSRFRIIQRYDLAD
jgi:putative phosphonate metabolism protein